MTRSFATPMALSSVATIANDGSVCHAANSDGSVEAVGETGR
jgi:hypothetical protein